MESLVNEKKQLFPSVEITPSWKQFVVNELPLIIPCLVAITAAGIEGVPYPKIIFWVGVILLIVLTYKLFYMLKIKYIITSQQIIYIHGVIGHTADYMELYRVVDYRQHSSPQQQIMGLKTITLYTGDRSSPVFNMIGIDRNFHIIEEIRERVEYNKQRKGIYEFTNR